MFSENNDYDSSVNTFSPEGRIYQIEYAINASKLGASGLCICLPSGIIIVSEVKKPKKLLEKPGIKKLNQIANHCFSLSSGLVFDSQQLIDSARAESLNHETFYNERISVKALTQSIADICLNFGEGDFTVKQKPISRPFGVTMLFGGVDMEGPSLYQVDPSGTVIGFKAKGIGSAEEAIQTYLETHYNENLTMEEGVILGLSIIKHIMEEDIREDRVDLVTIDQSGRAKTFDHSEIKQYLGRLRNLN